MTPTPEDVRFAFFTGAVAGFLIGLCLSFFIRRTRRNISRAYRAALKPLPDERSSIQRFHSIMGKDVKGGLK